MGIVCYYLHRNNDTVHYLNRFNDLAGVSRENMMKAQDSGMIKNATDILNELKAGEKLK
jgi:hypothetical protein